MNREEDERSILECLSSCGPLAAHEIHSRTRLSHARVGVLLRELRKRKVVAVRRTWPMEDMVDRRHGTYRWSLA